MGQQSPLRQNKYYQHCLPITVGASNQAQSVNQAADQSTQVLNFFFFFFLRISYISTSDTKTFVLSLEEGKEVHIRE